MARSGWNADGLLDYIETGLSVITWNPDDLARSEWVFVNDARCRMTGYSRSEILDLPPISITTRESRAQTEKIISEITTYGRFICESTLLHKSSVAIPVVMNMRRFRQGDDEFLVVEHQDIRSFKETESRLNRVRESTRELLSMVEREKQRLSKNIADNLELVVFPLLGQLRITATVDQGEVLDFLEDRIRRVTREMGVTVRSGGPGPNLTRRQILICEMIREGRTSKEIARTLDCSPSTVNNHRNIIRKKLGLSGKANQLQAFLNAKGGESFD